MRAQAGLGKSGYWAIGEAAQFMWSFTVGILGPADAGSEGGITLPVGAIRADRAVDHRWQRNGSQLTLRPQRPVDAIR